MGTKSQPSEFDCLSALLPDEPYFVLMARDPDAPVLVKSWARNRKRAVELDRTRPESDLPKCAEAMKLADQMIAWREEHDGEWRKEAVEVLPPA